MFTELGARPGACVHTHSLFGNTASTSWAVALDHRLKHGTVEGGDKMSSRAPHPGSRSWAPPPCGMLVRRYLRLYRAISKTFGLGAAARRLPASSAAAGDFGDDPGPRPRVLPPPSEAVDRSADLHLGNPRSGTTFLHRLLWEPAGWPPSSCGRCSSRPSRRASCSADRPATRPALARALPRFGRA